MGAVGHILDLWLHGLTPLQVLDEAAVVLAGARAREAARDLPTTRREAFVTAVLELARNQVRYAYGGWMDARVIDGGVEAVLADAGRGIAEPVRALRGELVRDGGLGAGFAGAYRLADEMDVDVRENEGTCLRVRKYASPPAARREVAVLGAPMPGEARSGDQSIVIRAGATVRMLVADGVGHGPAARDAADRAASRFLGHAGPLDELLRTCDADLRGTRGAAMTIAELRGASLDQISVGNIELRAIARDVRSFGTRVNGVVGAARTSRFVVEQTQLAPGEALAAFTDGIPSRMTLPVGAGHQPALVIAGAIFDQRRRDDDALVLVAK